MSEPTKKIGVGVLGKDFVWTPQIELLGHQIARWIQLELPGGTIYGVQRSGKTVALQSFGAQVEDFIGEPAFVSIFNAESGLADRETSLVSEWLNQAEKLPNANTPARLRRRLFEFFTEQAALRKTTRIILVIDEAQNLTHKHFGQVIAIGNVLALNGFRVFTLICGQPELASSVEGFYAMNQMQAVGRFFERSYEFEAIALLDIEVVIEAHESDVTCPDGSIQPSAIASLFPEAWASGWRPHAWAPTIVAGVKALAQKCGLPEDQRIPMQHLRSTLIHLLTHVKALGNPYEPISVELVVRGLVETGLGSSWSRYAAMMKR